MIIEAASLDWEIINDAVMGGCSSARAEGREDGVFFHGDLSLRNNGGFASMRAALHAPVSGFRSLRLKTSGDARRYQVRLRENDDSRGIAWRSYFRPSQKAAFHEFLLPDFLPVIRGRAVAGAQPLNTIKLNFIGLMLSDQVEGSFGLIIHEIEILGEEQGAISIPC